MKDIVKYILPVLVLFGSMACKKTDSTPVSNVVYEESIQNIKKNEPVLLTFDYTNNTAKVTWTVSPSANTTISTVGNSATIAFGAAGTYKVTATAGIVSAIYTIIVLNVEYTDYGTTFNLSASKQVNIEMNEPILFSVHNSNVSGSRINWSVFPGSFSISRDTIKNTATITFASSGFITVTASDGTITQSRSVWVNDPVNTTPDLDTIPFPLGEKLQLTPAIIIIAGTKQLVIQATTTNTYHCPTDKILSFASAGDYIIDYLGVTISPQPCTPASVATCTSNMGNVPVGMHSFTISFGNKTYKGSLNVSPSGIYTFTWPDQSGVSISPLVVQ